MLQLDERSPLRVLDRGYAIAYDAKGNVIRAADAVEIGEDISLRLARGRIEAQVRRRES